MRSYCNRATVFIKMKCTPPLHFYIILLLSFLLVFVAFPATSYADQNFPIIYVLHAGSHPEGIAVDTNTHMVYIAYESPGLVVGFDPLKQQVHWRRMLGDVATDVQVDSMTHRVYVASSFYQHNQGMLTVLDGTTGKTLLTAPTSAGDASLAIDTQRQRAYVSNEQGGSVNVFTLVKSPTTGDLTAEPSLINVGVGTHPQALGVNSRLGRLYVGDATGHKIIVFDENSQRRLATLSVADDPLPPIRIDEATGRVYVICSTGQELDVIDGNKNTIIAHVPVAPAPEGVAFNTATGRIYVANEGSDENSTTITVIDGKSFTVLGTLQVGRAPDGVEADPALRRVYVSVENSDAIVEISDSANIVLQTENTLQQITEVRQGIFFLQQAMVITLVAMIVTILVAMLRSWMQHRQVREHKLGQSHLFEKHEA